MVVSANARLADSPPDAVDALVAARRYDEARAYYVAAAAERPDDPEPARGLGDVAVMRGRIDEALGHYRRASALAPARRIYHELLSGALAERGDFAGARAVLRAFHRDHPMDDGPLAADVPILKIAGSEGTYCRLGADGGPRPNPFRRGGHFSTRNLLPRRRFPARKWTIADGNINARADVPACRLILNAIAEPDIEPGPLAALIEYLRRHPEIPVVNRPERVLQTARDANALRLNRVPGVMFPRTHRYRRGSATPEEAARAVAGFGLGFPLIVREVGTHTGRTVTLMRTPDELTGYFTSATGESFYAIQFVEEKFDDGPYYNKKRVFFIDGRMYPVVSHMDAVWNVHGFNRVAVMRNHPWMQDQEKAFVEDPARSIGAENCRRLEAIAELIGLDFFGVDFTVRRDGTLLVFEANAAMRHSHDHADNFPYLGPHMIRITEAFAGMIERKLAL